MFTYPRALRVVCAICSSSTRRTAAFCLRSNIQKRSKAISFLTLRSLNFNSICLPAALAVSLDKWFRLKSKQIIIFRSVCLCVWVLIIVYKLWTLWCDARAGTTWPTRCWNSTVLFFTKNYTQLPLPHSLSQAHTHTHVQSFTHTHTHIVRQKVQHPKCALRFSQLAYKVNIKLKKFID